MKQMLNFFKESGVFYLATAEEEQPHVRPMGFIMEWEGKLAFCTSNKKNMYKQLISNPKVELCAFNGKDTLRIIGKVSFVTSPESQQKALDTMPALQNTYSVNDGSFEIFCLEDVTAV